MKKKWLNPQLMNLGVQETREDETDEQLRHVYRCRHCCEKFNKKEKRNKHEKTCIYRKPADMLPGQGQEVPIS